MARRSDFGKGYGTAKYKRSSEAEKPAGHATQQPERASGVHGDAAMERQEGELLPEAKGGDGGEPGGGLSRRSAKALSAEEDEAAGWAALRQELAEASSDDEDEGRQDDYWALSEAAPR